MNHPDMQTVDLDINVSLPSQHWSESQAVELQKLLESYPVKLFQSLDLPIQSYLQVTRSGDEEQASADRLRISFNNRSLQLMQSEITSDLISAQGGLGESVARAICRARHYAVTREVARITWRSWFPDELEQPHSALLDSVEYLIREAVRHGFRLSRLAPHANRLSTPNLDLWAIQEVFEESIRRFEETAISLYLSPPHYAIYEQLTEQVSQGEESEQSTTDFPEENIFELLQLMSDGLYYELGISYGYAVEQDPMLTTNSYRIMFNDMYLPVMQMLAEDEILVNDSADRLQLLNLGDQIRPSINPANGRECAILTQGPETQKICAEAGLMTWGPNGHMILTISSEIRQHAGAFLTSIELYTDKLSAAFPDLVACARRLFDLTKLTRIFRLLLNEAISIRDMRRILEALLSIDDVTHADESRLIIFEPNTGIKAPVGEAKTIDSLDTEDYAASIRSALKHQISHQYSRGQNALVVYLISPDIEQILRQSNGAIPDAFRDRLIDAVYDEVGSLPSSYEQPVILTTSGIRQSLRQLLEVDFPRLSVIAYQELSPTMNIQPIARISFE